MLENYTQKDNIIFVLRESKNQGKRSSGMPPKILIVDDDRYICTLIKETLGEIEDEGVELLIAHNGSKALEIIKKEKPQLVFLDVMMPVMNGYDVCQKVKKELRLDNIFIVILSARGQDYDKAKSQEVGADIHISKPFDPDDILKQARKVLEL